ncbi:MAG: ABC transporter substrate-binding protein, partial [Clostridia bacterium]|nr:ABC transporter substrate-binding protein [Clostridia bacterium]
EDAQEVLASWLFAQYLLTNEVQIAYSGTEGYVPVTSKAQQSAEYVDYLSRAGEDNQHYYRTKIEAAQLLLSNTGNTFVTPVFNGSASLRNAAGQMIEEVTKGTRRKKDVNDAFITDLYADMTSLYRLDQIETSSGGKAELGPLPGAARALIGALIAAWVLIVFYVAVEAAKKKSRRH